MFWVSPEKIKVSKSQPKKVDFWSRPKHDVLSTLFGT